MNMPIALFRKAQYKPNINNSSNVTLPMCQDSHFVKRSNLTDAEVISTRMSSPHSQDLPRSDKPRIRGSKYQD